MDCVSVLDYDDLHAAVTAAAAGGFDLCIPENTTVSCSVPLSNPSWPTGSEAWRGVTIRGHNRYTSKILFTATNGGSGTADVEPTLAHMTVEIDAAARMQLGNVRDCDIIDNHTTGVFFIGGVGLMSGYSVDQMTNCYIESNQNGSTVNVQACTVTGCTFVDLSGTGAGVAFDTAEMSGCQIRNYKTVSQSFNVRDSWSACRVETRNVSGATVTLQGRVSGCAFTAASTNGTFVVDGTVSASSFSGRPITTNAATLSAVTVGSIPTGSAAITVTSTGPLIMSGCSVAASNSGAVSGSTNATWVLTGCHFSGSAGTGISNSGTSACVVVGNVISGFATATSLPVGSVDANNL